MDAGGILSCAGGLNSNTTAHAGGIKTLGACGLNSNTTAHAGGILTYSACGWNFNFEYMRVEF